MSSTDQNRYAILRFLGGCLMAVGGLIAVSCGLCTAAFVFLPLIGSTGPGQFDGYISYLIWPLVIGGVPTVVGTGLFFIGRFIWLRAKPPRAADPEITFS